MIFFHPFIAKSFIHNGTRPLKPPQNCEMEVLFRLELAKVRFQTMAHNGFDVVTLGNGPGVPKG
jgi:hypothetical protein